jgi:hypothetical protein
MEIGKFKLAKADLVRPPNKPAQEQIIPKQKPYTEKVFKLEVDDFIKGLIGGFPKDEMLLKIQSVLDKAVDAGAIEPQEGIKYLRERKKQLVDFARENYGQELPGIEDREDFAIGGGVIEGKDLGSRTGFSSPEAVEYLKNLEPGTTVNTYEIGKKFEIAPATVRGQIQRNFPDLKLQTKEESAAKATETRKEIYKQKKSDLPIVETKIRGKGKEFRSKGRDVIGVRWPNKEMEENYIKDLKEKYSGKLGQKGLTNTKLAEKYFGSSSSGDISRVEKINNFLTKNLNLKFKKADPNIVKEKRKRRLSITQGGKTFRGTDQIPFHHIMPIGGEVDLTTKDVAFINKQMNSALAPYNTKLNDIADAISNQLNNQAPGYLDRVDELNKNAEQIIESVKIRLPKKYQNYIGFNRLDPITDEYGTPIRMNVTRVGVDDSKSLAGKRGTPQKLENLTQKSLMDQIKNLKIKIPTSDLLGLGSKLPGPFKLLKLKKNFEDGGIVSRQNLKGGYLAGGIKSLGKKYKDSTLEALLENPKLIGTEIGYEGLAEILRLLGLYSVGGRVGYADGPEDPSKRKFMKVAAGLASLPIVGKFFKPAVKVAPAVVESAKGIPDFIFDLVAKVKARAVEKGMKYFTGNKVDEFEHVYKADDFIVKEKGNKITLREVDDPDRPGYRENEIELEVDPETGGVTYNEASVRPDAEGKLKDVEEFIDDIDLENMRKYTYDE